MHTTDSGACPQEHPSSVGTGLQQLLALAEGGNADTRGGLATALRTVAPLLAEEQVAAALDFLLGEGLADPDPNVREQMVIAGLRRLPCCTRPGQHCCGQPMETPISIVCENPIPSILFKVICIPCGHVSLHSTAHHSRPAG